MTDEDRACDYHLISYLAATLIWALLKTGNEVCDHLHRRTESDVPGDYAKLSNHLQSFYDFAGKVVLLVGAGGRRLLSPELQIKKLIAINQDADALREFQSKPAQVCGQRTVEVLPAKFENVIVFGDVVYFEFCLHEMTDPGSALLHASELAPDIVVFDHSRGSDWAFYAAEEEKVWRSSDAMKHFGIRRRRTLQTEQRFADYPEFLSKVSPQGPVAAQRAERYLGRENIIIPMDCELVFLSRHS